MGGINNMVASLFPGSQRISSQQLEWDQKLWWVHIEALISLLKGYQLTGSQECLSWFEKVHDYTWTHFKDPARNGGATSTVRRGVAGPEGGKWKGCFHVPRDCINVGPY